MERVLRASAWDQDFESESAAVAAAADKGRADKSDKTGRVFFFLLFKKKNQVTKTKNQRHVMVSQSIGHLSDGCCKLVIGKYFSYRPHS